MISTARQAFGRWFARWSALPTGKAGSSGRANHILFLDALRAIACLMVVYCHWIPHAPTWPPAELISTYVSQPLGVIWNFGYLGVAIFFVISGFIIAHVAQEETGIGFGTKRFFRIVPPAVLAILLGGAAVWLAGFQIERWQGVETVFEEVSLVWSNFWFDAPTYTLIIELTFYAIVWACLPLTRTQPVLAILLVAFLPVGLHYVGVEYIAPLQIDKLTRFFGYTPFVSIFAIGMAIYFAWTGRLRLRYAAILSLLAWGCFVYATPAATGDGFGFKTNTAIAVAIFCAGLWLGPRWAKVPFLILIGRLSFSIYLLHVPLIRIFWAFVNPHLGFTWTTLLLLPTIFVAALIFNRAVEVPSQRLARWLLGRRKSPRALAAPTVSSPA